MPRVISRLIAAAIAAAVVAVAGAAAAQPYPSRPIRLIVTFPPGGSTDILARAMGQKFTEMWGQQVVIENRPGAGGIIGTELGARAPRDGYTLLMGSGAPLTIIPSLYEKLPYDPLKDFAPITVVATVPNVLALHPSVPARTLSALAARTLLASAVLVLAIAVLVAVTLPYGEFDALAFGTWSRLLAAHFPTFHFSSIDVPVAAYHRPLFFVLQAALWKLFGFHEWLGRLLSLGFTVVLVS